MRTSFKSPEGQYKLTHEYKARKLDKITKITRRVELNALGLDAMDHNNDQKVKTYITLSSPGNIGFYNLTEQSSIKDFNCKGAMPTCQKLNKASSLTKQQNLDLIVGFSTGEISLVTQKPPNTTFNTNKIVDKTPVRCVSWGPPIDRLKESNIFLTGHESGNIYVYNKTLSDEQPLTVPPDSKYNESRYFTIQRDTKRVNPLTRIHLSNYPVTDMKYSPNGRYLAATSEDGYLYVIDYQTYKLRVVFQSFYGALLCCCWSPDARYIVTGGEDDLISVYDIQERCILARGRGHSSYISMVTFDCIQCDSDRYRIVSAGQDTRLMLWDIDKLEQTVDGAVDIVDGKKKHGTSTPTPSNERKLVFVKSLPQNEVPYFEPVGVVKAHAEPLRDLVTCNKGIITVCNQGVVKMWSRPSDKESTSSRNSLDKSGQEENGEHELHHNDLELELPPDN